MSFRFAHTADVHLDSPLKGLSAHEGTPVERIRTATREAFANLVTCVIEEEASFLIIAGDLYDGDWRDYQTGLFFIQQIGRLNKAHIPVFILYGNHDAESQITKRLLLPRNAKAFSTKRPETFRLDEIGVALHGQSFRQRDVTENLVPAYPDPIAKMFNIGVLHTGLGGLGGHANYAPCALDDLIHKGYDYWALGHVHQRSVLHEKPHVVFPGNLQGRHIRELGAKGASLVTVDDLEITDVAFLDVDVVRWSLVEVSVEGYDRLSDVIDSLRQGIEEAVSRDGQGRLLTCRIQLTGRTEIHDQVLASKEHLLAEARAAALGLGDEVAWVEDILICTQSMLDQSTLQAREDAIGELQTLLKTASEDPALIEQYRTHIGDMMRKLPHEIRVGVEDTILKTAINGDYADLIGATSDYLMGRLTLESR